MFLLPNTNSVMYQLCISCDGVITELCDIMPYDDMIAFGTQLHEFCSFFSIMTLGNLIFSLLVFVSI